MATTWTCATSQRLASLIKQTGRRTDGQAKRQCTDDDDDNEKQAIKHKLTAKNESGEIYLASFSPLSLSFYPSSAPCLARKVSDKWQANRYLDFNAQTRYQFLKKKQNRNRNASWECDFRCAANAFKDAHKTRTQPESASNYSDRTRSSRTRLWPASTWSPNPEWHAALFLMSCKLLQANSMRGLTVITIELRPNGSSLPHQVTYRVS